MSEKLPTFMGMPVTPIIRKPRDAEKGKRKVTRAPPKPKQLRFFAAKEDPGYTYPNDIDIWVKEAQLFVRLTPLWRGRVMGAANRYQPVNGPVKDSKVVLKYHYGITVVSRMKFAAMKGNRIAVHDSIHDVFVLLPEDASEKIITAAKQERARRSSPEANTSDPVSVTDAMLGYPNEGPEPRVPKLHPAEPIASIDTDAAQTAPKPPSVSFQVFEEGEDRGAFDPLRPHIDYWVHEVKLYVRLPADWASRVVELVQAFLGRADDQHTHDTEDGFRIMTRERAVLNRDESRVSVRHNDSGVCVTVRKDWGDQIIAAGIKAREERDEELLAEVRRRVKARPKG